MILASIIASIIVSIIATGGVATARAQPAVGLGVPIASTPSELVRPIAIRELPDGTVLIADQAENQLLHYSFATGASRDIGRVGSGPGEYRTVAWLYALKGDTTLLTDSYTGRWFVLVGTRVVKTFAEQEPMNLLLTGLLDGASSDGHVVATRSHVYAKGARRSRTTADTNVLIRANWRTGIVDTVVQLAGRGARGYTEFPATATRLHHLFPTNPLAAAEQGLLFPDGWLAIVRLRPYRVEWRDPNARWIRGAALPTYTPRAPTLRDKCNAIAQITGGRFACEPDAWNGWPDVVPPLAQMGRPSIPWLLADADGNLVIERLRTAGANTRSYDVVDRQGKLTRTLSIAVADAVIGFSAKHVYVVHTDDDDLKALRQYARPW